MEVNSLRRLNWLWKNRHTHDGDTEAAETRQTIIEVINEEQPPGSGNPDGAYIHLERAANQSISSGTATAVSWDTQGLFTPRNFDTPSLPSSQLTVQESGYYDIHLGMKLAAAVDSPSASITLTRSGTEQTVWPMPSDPGVWTADYETDRFSGTAKGVPLLSGDVIQAYVEHSEGSPVNLTEAVFAVELVDRVPESSSGANVNSAYYAETSSSTDHPVTLPGASDGDLLVVGVTTLGDVTITFPAGWTDLGSENISTSDKLSSKWAYRVADGTEDGSVDVTLGSSSWAIGHSVVIVGDTDWSAPDINTTSDDPADGASDPGPGQPPTVTVTSSGNHIVLVSYFARNLQGLSGPAGWEELEVHDLNAGGVPQLASLLSESEISIASTLAPGVVNHASYENNIRGRTMATIAVRLEE